MYDAESLLDLHERGHRSLVRLLQHCRAFGADELNRELPGFGYPSIRIQLIHEIGAEAYWIGVLEGRMDAEDRDAEFLTVESIEGWRVQVAAATQKVLRAASTEELNTVRSMRTFGGREQSLLPARVVLRVFTHLYHHQGQIVAMCRLLGKPVAGLDFPIA